MRREKAAAEQAARSSTKFADWLPVASPAPWVWSWRHLALMRRELERLDAGECDRLMFSTPPRHGKSEQNTIRYPAYRIETAPSTRVIMGAHTAALAKKFSRRTRALCRARGVSLNAESQAADDWETDSGGGERAVGVGGAIAGVGADLVVLDDPVKSRAEAESPAYRERLWDWYRDDIVTRLEPDGQMILTMTRWHEDDLAGRILASEEASDWRIVNLEALCETEDDPLGRARGEALCPERFDEAQLQRLRRILGRTFNALYQGRPTAAEGNIIKREWFRYWTERPAEEFIMVVQSWDTASKDSEVDNCPSVCHTWGVTRFGYYLLDEYRDWIDYPTLRTQAQALAERWDANVVLIEDKSNGTALLQELRNDTRVPCVAVEPRTDKVSRLSNQSTAYEAGLVYHPAPRNSPWIGQFEDELCGAPATAYMDRADAVSQFLAWARVNAGRFDWEAVGRAEEMERALGDASKAPGLDDFTFGRVSSASTSTRGF